MTKSAGKSELASTYDFCPEAVELGAASTPRVGDDKSSQMFAQSAVATGGATQTPKPPAGISPFGAGSMRIDFT